MKIKSKYLNRFNKVNTCSEVRAGIKLYGDKFLVEVIPEEELKTEGGIILSSATNFKSEANSLKAKLGIVIMVGEGYYDDTTGEDVPLDIQPGNIVLLSDMGLRYYTTFPGIQEYTAKEIALSRETEVHMKFDNVEAFYAYQDKLTTA